jgi:hypothetical protein
MGKGFVGGREEEGSRRLFLWLQSAGTMLFFLRQTIKEILDNFADNLGTIGLF